MTWSYGQTFDHVTEIKIDGNYLVLRDTTDNDSTQYAAWKIDYLIYDNHLELKNNDRTVLFTPIDSLVEVDKSTFTIQEIHAYLRDETGFSPGGTSPLPTDLDNLLAFFPAKNESRTAWNTPGFQLNNLGSGPDAQMLTGGGIDFTAANSDYVSIPSITLSGDFTICGWTYLLSSGQNNFIANSSAVRSRLKIDGADFGVWTQNPFNGDLDSPILVDGYHQITLSREGTEFIIYIDGEANTTFTHDATDFVVNAIANSNGAFVSSQASNYALFNSTLTPMQISTLYNNPNDFIELSRSYGADRIYPLTEGIYEDESPVLEYSGNAKHGQFLTSAAGAYDAALNNLPVGLQTGTYGSSFNYYMDGVDDNIAYGSTTLTTNGDYVEVKFYHTTQTSKRILGSTDDAGYLFRTGTITGNEFQFRVNFSSLYTSTASLVQNAINTVRVTKNSSNYTITINGVVDGTLNTSNNYEFDQVGSEYIGLYVSFNYNGSIIAPYNNWGDKTINGSPTVRRILPTSDTGTTDLFGNTTQYKWVEGILNFNGGFHGGLQIGNSTSSLDGSEISFFFFGKFIDDTGSRYIFDNRDTGDGVRIIASFDDYFDIGNETSSTFNTLQADNSLTDDAFYMSYFEIASDGTADIYYSTVGNDLTSDVTPTDIGTLGNGTEIPHIGIREGGATPWLSYMNLIIYGDTKTSEELNSESLKGYAELIINQLEP